MPRRMRSSAQSLRNSRPAGPQISTALSVIFGRREAPTISVGLVSMRSRSKSRPRSSVLLDRQPPEIRTEQGRPPIGGLHLTTRTVQLVFCLSCQSPEEPLSARLDTRGEQPDGVGVADDHGPEDVLAGAADLLSVANAHRHRGFVLHLRNSERIPLGEHWFVQTSDSSTSSNDSGPSGHLRLIASGGNRWSKPVSTR